MKQFNVLARNLNVHQHYLLEASAGTGKTFSIQNIVVRLLIETSESQLEPLLLPQILVVTFTKAATRDLRQRIRANIEQCIHFISEWLHEKAIHPNLPDYLLAILESGFEAACNAKKRLQQALFSFDQAQIFTIHSFCARMLKQHALESDMGFQSGNGESGLPLSEVMAIIHDFFRTEMRPESYSPAQLAIILKEDPEQKKLLRAIQSGYDFTESPSFKELFQMFVGEMHKLKSLGFEAEKISEDFEAQYTSYRNYKSGETKAETLAKATRFAALFDQEKWVEADFDLLINDDLVWIQALDPKLLKVRASLPSKLNYPDFGPLLKKTLEPLVRQASNFGVLLARMARECRVLLRRYQQEEEKLSPDDLLVKMNEALDQPKFLALIQAAYQAAIIDEFQDTDPLQWQIFRRLYLPDDCRWKGYLYLVGDPKQSIYSFRQADIYTYLSAARALGEHYCFSLDTNYRSQPSLVQALNTLFSQESAPQLIPLPKHNSHLPYQPVRAAKNSLSKDFPDERGPIHFCVADGKAFKRASLNEFESQVFFPFIAKEIKWLSQCGLAYRQIAVLVRDRYQALRLAEFLDEKKIPYVNQRGTSLVESSVLASLIDLLRAVLHPYDMGAVKAALGSPLLGWTQDEMKLTQQMDQVLTGVHRLRQGLIDKGFSYFFQELLQSSWQTDGLSVLERLLAREDGIDFYHDLQQLSDIIIDHQYEEWNSPEGLIPFLDRLSVWEANEDERIKRFQDPDKNGVKILTLHVSKGLEFDVVFALGLVNRTSSKDDLILIEQEGRKVFTPLLGEREEYQSYFEECDAEKMRQLYVALTRAKYRLYIPTALSLASSPQIGEASPLDLFLAQLAQESASYSELYKRMKTYDGKVLVDYLDSVGKMNGMTYSIHSAIEGEDQPDQEPTLFKELMPPRTVAVSAPSLAMTSFTRLTQSLTRDTLPEASPQDFDHSIKNVHTLPSSADVGLFLHQILEKIPFHLFAGLKSSDQALSFLQPYIKLPKFKEWESVIGSLVYNALKTPLPLGSGHVCLADIAYSQMFREMPFLFPADKPLHIEDVYFSKGLIKGVVDLIFQYQGKYYIVDWKSNWLGSSFEAYQSSHLQQCMKEHCYFLQASLYTEALQRYLKLVDKRPFKECFGGAYYLFLRGLQPNGQTGICFVSSSA